MLGKLSAVWPTSDRALPPVQGQRREEAAAGRQMESLASNANFPAIPRPAPGRRPSAASLAPGTHRPNAGSLLARTQQWMHPAMLAEHDIAVIFHIACVAVLELHPELSTACRCSGGGLQAAAATAWRRRRGGAAGAQERRGGRGQPGRSRQGEAERRAASSGGQEVRAQRWHPGVPRTKQFAACSQRLMLFDKGNMLPIPAHVASAQPRLGSKTSQRPVRSTLCFMPILTHTCVPAAATRS